MFPDGDVKTILDRGYLFGSLEGDKGFTILAMIDPEMHPSDQAKAVFNLFDGEISITQSDDPLDCKKSIQVKKLRGQDYIKNPICLINLEK